LERKRKPGALSQDMLMEVNNGMPTSCAIALGCAAIHFNKMLTPFIDVCITDKERVRDNDYNSRCV
jgi:hypothetical protein